MNKKVEFLSRLTDFINVSFLFSFYSVWFLKCIIFMDKKLQGQYIEVFYKLLSWFDMFPLNKNSIWYSILRYFLIKIVSFFEESFE